MDERALAERFGVADLYDELKAEAERRNITFEQALMEVRALQHGEPEPLPADLHEKPRQEPDDPGEHGDYVEDEAGQDAIWNEAE